MNIFSFLNKKNKHGNQRVRPGYVGHIHMIGNDPFVDWVLILGATCVIAILLIGVGSYVYVDTQDQLASVSVPRSNTSSAALDTKKLTEVISAFDVRANERVMLGKGYVGPSDPSLP